MQQRIQQFHSQEFLNSLRGTTQFAGTDYRSKDLTPKKSRLLAEGFEGPFRYLCSTKASYHRRLEEVEDF
jgi:hypothetical protein